MISFCLLNEDKFDDWQGSGVLSTNNFDSPESYVAGLESDIKYGSNLFADRKGRDNNMAGPGDSLWSWVPGSDESNAENKIEDTEAMIRRIKNEPELFYAYKNGTNPPSFLDSDHKVGYLMNTVADNKLATALTAGALTGAAYFAKKKHDMNKMSNPQNNANIGVAESFRNRFQRNQ